MTTTFTASGGIVSSEEACSASNAKAARLAAVGLGMAVLRRGGWRARAARACRALQCSSSKLRVAGCSNALKLRAAELALAGS